MRIRRRGGHSCCHDDLDRCVRTSCTASAAPVLWAVAFSWWAPGPFFPVMIVVIVLVAIFGRRGRRERPDIAEPPAAGDLDDAGVSLSKDASTETPDRPSWMGDTRQWMTE